MIWTRVVLGLVLGAGLLHGQQTAHVVSAEPDTDKDGLSDELEQRLLTQFAPSFMVGKDDCSNVPAEFVPEMKVPTVKTEDGTIYGQAFPVKSSSKDAPEVEIHFYHLWRIDCGRHGHPLDTEHVSALVRASGPDVLTAKWTAVYWYAAAHEQTVCDVSQIARASTLHAEEHGANVWISPGKHASYLNETLCQRGCGADKCEQMTALPAARIVNLGEPGRPMNGSVFVASNQWPLLGKMEATNFPAEPLGRLEKLPETDIAWYSAGRHPAQQIISISGRTELKLANSADNTGSAISTAGDATGGALSTAQDSTGNALGKSYRKTTHALGTSARHVGQALHVTPKDDPAKQPE
ncbi:hypothetical protein [Granulicella tundricola]|uniref:Uncharacterized protein n=1 Tax=Granulicella tundricola (strain ATCC BAA-1859 / DSM 23138 / MP5ACTX9) TaxID=1198114 RepID=E8WY34_GRATM|nr:hypothetical protein [Granulicella tundricola]ADW67573.1 hypothetical protein AciX9_0501 [Granulicella tundricola MP5ACTX9]